MKVQWRVENGNQIKKNFNTKASHRLFEMFRDTRITKEMPKWIGEHVWNKFLAHCNSPMYRNKGAIRKIWLLKRVEACTQVAPSPHMNMSFVWYTF